MKKKAFLSGVLFLSFSVFATTSTSQSNNQENTNSDLDNKEKFALKLAEEWKKQPNKPRKDENGNVKYLFGSTLPTLICAPMQVCSIMLQPGETINDIHAGETSRWKITPATKGTAQDQTTLIIVKPTETGLTTNLIITTDRRIYTIKLLSTKHDWIPVLSFDYPDDLNQQWMSYIKNQQQNKYANTLSNGQNIRNLDFNFKITGDNPNWKPIRIYSDGIKTYIQFPSKNLREAPALVILNEKEDESSALVNYRLVDDLYIVDKVLQRAALIVGIGKAQKKVEIIKTN